MKEGVEGRLAVITGGTGALGQEVVRAFVQAGARVRVPWIDRGEADALEALVGEEALRNGALRLFEADVTAEASVSRFFGSVEDEDGMVEILLNLTGGFAASTLEKTSAEGWQRMLSINATSAFLCARAAAPGMRAAGWGRIVNVAARPAVERGAAKMSAYAASKAAVLSLTYSLAEELLAFGITVNAVVPTTIDTPANRRAMPAADRSTWLPPAGIARVLLFLASEEASLVTGSALTLDRA